MNAKKLRDQMGADLVGRAINTERYGEYPGGLATVTEITPDPKAPEIVFQVKHHSFGDIGIFDHEEVELIDPKPMPSPTRNGWRPGVPIRKLHDR